MSYDKLQVCKASKKAKRDVDRKYNSGIVEKDGEIAMILPDKVPLINETIIEAQTLAKMSKKMVSDSKRKRSYEQMEEDLNGRKQKLHKLIKSKLEK